MIPTRSFAALACTLTLALAAGPGLAQDSAASPAKKALVQRALVLQQPGIENVGNALANQTAGQMMQAAGQAVMRLPVDQREAAANDVKAEVRKFYEDAAALLRERAVKLGPETIGATLESKFSEDELKVLVAWLESPVNKKFQQLAGEMHQSLSQKLVASTRETIEPKIKALEQALTKRLGVSAPAAASAPAKGASAPAKGAPTPKK